MKKWHLLIVAIFILAFTGCKDDEAELEATKMKLIDRLEKLNVPEVMRDSENPNAQQAVGYVDQVKGVQSYFSWFDVPEDATREKSASLSGGDVYYWSYGGASVWETYTESGSKYIWQIDIDYGTGTGRQKYMYSEEEKDGSYGNLKIFNIDQESEKYVFMYEWKFDSNENANLVWKDYEESFVYEIQSNADLSGYAKLLSSGELIYHFLWNTDGSGSYKLYGDGEVYEESWTVADL